MIDLRKTASVVGALVTLGIIALMVLNAYGDYRDTVKAQKDGASTEQTSSVETTGAPTGGEGTGTAEVAAPFVTVVAEGLNLRVKPMTNSKVIKRLKKDEKLVLVEKGAGWYKVRDAAGDEGWVAAGGQYSKLTE